MLCAGGHLHAAKELLAELSNSSKTSMAAPAFLLISLHSKCCDWKAAYSIYQKLLASGVRPDGQTMSSLIDALWQAGTAAATLLAVSLFEEACKMGLLRSVCRFR